MYSVYINLCFSYNWKKQGNMRTAAAVTEKTRLPGEDSYSQHQAGQTKWGSSHPIPEWAKPHFFLSDKWNNENRKRGIVRECMQWKHSKIFSFNMYSFISLIYSNKLIRNGNQISDLIQDYNQSYKLLLLLLPLFPTLFSEVLWVATDTIWQPHP